MNIEDRIDFIDKCLKLYNYLRDRDIINIYLVNCDNNCKKIVGFGYTDILTPNNIDYHLEHLEEDYEKWYCRWNDAYCDELKELQEEIRGLYYR